MSRGSWKVVPGLLGRPSGMRNNVQRILIGGPRDDPQAWNMRTDVQRILKGWSGLLWDVSTAYMYAHEKRSRMVNVLLLFIPIALFYCISVLPLQYLFTLAIILVKIWKCDMSTTLNCTHIETFLWLLLGILRTSLLVLYASQGNPGTTFQDPLDIISCVVCLSNVPRKSTIFDRIRMINVQRS